MPTNINLPANLPENWQTSQIVSPSGTDVGLSAQHGYNYLMQQVNDTQEAANTLSQAVDAQEEAQAQLETDVDTLQTDMAQAKSDVETLQTDVGELQTDVGNLQTGQGQLATPNATATHSDSVVAITAPAGVNLISFYAPSDFSGDDTYTVNGSAVTLTDLNGNAIYDGWKEGAPVQFILKGTQAFFKAGGGLNGDLPPINPNMSGSLEDGVFTVTADKLPVSQANELAGAEWYYADHVPARPGDGTKIELSKSQLVDFQGGKAAGDYNAGDVVKIKENGSPVEFICLKHGYPTLDNGMTLFRRKYSYTDSVMSSDKGYGKYEGSNVDTILTTSYISLFSESVRAMLQTVNIPQGSSTLARNVFTLSQNELGYDSQSTGWGDPIAYFSDNAHRIVTRASGEAVAYSTRYVSSISSSTAVWYVGSDGSILPGNGTTSYGVVPCIVLSDDALFDPDTNELIEDATGVQTLADTTNLGDETEGSIVTLLESGAPTQFYVSKQNYQNDINGNGRVLLVRKDVYDLRVWAADNIPTYADSDIDAWFNGEYKAKFSSYIQDKMGATKFYYTVGNGNNSVVQLERPVFALSLTELGITIEYANIEGVALPNAEDLKIAYLSGTPQLQWTRSPAISNITNVYRLSKTGTYSTASPNDTSYSRPCFTLPADMQVNPDGSIVEQESLDLSVSIPWTSSSYIYVRQFPYNSKHQYQTQLVGAVATNDPDYGSGPPDDDPVLANNTWEQIAAASESGIAADTWQVGDTKDIVVGGETLTVEIVGFNHDDLADGSGKAGITFGLKNLMANTRQMNSSNTNAGGFTGSDMYEWLQGTLLNSLPSDLQAVLKSVNKKTSAGNESSTINTNAMKIFLFSEIEIFGSVTYSKSGEGSQYSRFATASSRIKYLSNGSGSAKYWWERSPRGDDSASFCNVSGGGNANGNYAAGNSGGVCFGFCV